MKNWKIWNTAKPETIYYILANCFDDALMFVRKNYDKNANSGQIAD